MGIKIERIETYLPSQIVTNDDIKKIHPYWNIEKVEKKTGVYSRYIAGKNETAFDLSIKAIEKIFNSVDKNKIDGIIYCTQTPDYIMPSNAFLVHKHFNLKFQVFAFDYNLACSGYIYGLILSRGLIDTNIGKNILLINSDTYSKLINNNDRSASLLFGDGASVTLISKDQDDHIIDVIIETNGQKYDIFYVPAGGHRIPHSKDTKIESEDNSGNIKTLENIHMNGFAVWEFIAKVVPDQIKLLLDRNNLLVDNIKYFVLHQASKMTINSLQKRLKIPNEKIYMNLDKYGNTVSVSIPLVLSDIIENGRIKSGDLIIMSGFGVGLSWGSILYRV